MPSHRTAPTVSAIVVTYCPDVDATARLLAALRPQVAHVVVVDNASPAASREALRVAAGSVDAELVVLDANLGIAVAQNVGITRARERSADFVLLFDQDSLPAPDMVERLLAGFRRAQDGPVPVAAVGPVTVDERNQGATLLFEAQRWGPRRAPVPVVDGDLVPVIFLLASGCLIAMSAIDAVGPMNAEWFIDHIDLEWGLRADRAGYAMYGVAGAHLAHSLGDRTVRIPGRERDVHIHSPIRNYYMARNTILLVRSGLLSWTWRVGYVAWITKYSIFYATMMRPRSLRVRQLLSGLRDGTLGRTGARKALR